jgi:Zn-dependent peptidase ImmA (M78 family)/DNA-binding XRE family transcriptional regulator
VFNPTRLALARKRRGKTKLVLAKDVGVTTRMIIAYEAGAYSPSDDTLVKLAAALRFPPSFFHAEDAPQISLDGSSFRSLKSMTAAQRESALAAGTLAVEISRWMDERFDLPKPNVPSMRGYDPETAAEALRARWRIGEKTIENMVRLLEFQGVRVFSLPIDSASVDAFSVWHDRTPFVFLNSLKSSERSRFDAAHELAHLTLHQHGAPQGRLAESQADHFASAFLIPRNTLLASAPRNPTLRTLIQLKKKWKVALIALVHRLYALNLLSEWQYRGLCIEIASEGYRKSDPESIQRESSELLAKVLGLLREDGFSRGALAKELNLEVGDLDLLVRGLVLASVEGRGQQKGPMISGRPSLQLIKTPSK